MKASLFEGFLYMHGQSDRSVDSDGSGTGREVEIKFRTNPAGLKQVLGSPAFASPAAVRSEMLRSIHFDTSQGDLRKRGMTLRIRKRGRGGPLLGLKVKRAAADGPFSRTEIEVRSRSLQPDLALFDEDVAAELGRLVEQRPLEPQFEIKVRRRTVLVKQGDSQIELACDDGSIVAGDRNAALAEVELELKSGNESDLCDLAMKLADEFPLRLDFTAKAERGFCLLTGENSPVVRATPIEYGADATLDDAVVAVISNTLAQFIGNWDALRTSNQPNAVHQARVALRRLRVALGIFKHALPCPQFDGLQNEARRIASAFGQARECDVFRASAAEGPLAHADRPVGSETLLTSIEERRAAAYGDVRALIEDIGTTRFVLEVRSLLARRAWRNALTGSQLVQLAGPAEAFAREALDRLLARALKRGRNFVELSDEARHDLRIALKKLRYCAEFFETLFGGHRKIRRYTKTVSSLQDLLGAHNDGVIARQILDEFPPGMEGASGFILGWFARESSLADARLMETWNSFKKTDPFWR